ncbi:MAG TPA: PEP-CTERM sorting domain-containing protein [Tepidisphaeraceae bacterium]|jgi:plastocyanin
MLRTWIALLSVGTVIAAWTPAAFACNCGSGGACHCGLVCACGDESSGGSSAGGAMTAPTERIVAAATAAPTTVHVPVNVATFGADVTIHVGDTVQWDWTTPLFHTITTVQGSTESFDSGTILDGPYSHTFAQTGTIVYFCEIHGFDNFDGTATGMAASVTVLPVPEPITLAAVLPLGAMTLLRRRRRSTPS